MKQYHILSLSGGKDSSALAFYIKDNMPEIHKQIEYVFCDTESELPETYDYLNKLELFLNKKITRVKAVKNFEYLMDMYGYFPSPFRRWCTVEMKTRPFRKYIYDLFKQKGEGIVNLYLGIRADEARRAKKHNKYGDSYIKEVYTFIENNVNKDDVFEILENAKVGLPDYYQWATRSGCYFCPYQSKMTWLNLYEHHRDLFMKAKSYEDKINAQKKPGQKKVSWNIDMLLEDMIKPENAAKIRADYEEKQKKRKCDKPKKLINLFTNMNIYEEEDECDNMCLFCHI